MDITIQQITTGLIGLAVVILAIMLGVTWYYLRTFGHGISSLSEDTAVFREVARSLSQNIQLMNQSSVALSQDIKTLSQGTSTLSQDIQLLSQSSSQTSSALSHDIEALGKSIDVLSESYKETIARMEKVDQKQDEAAKAVQRMAKHFAE